MKKEIQIEINLTPEELAFEFSEMDDRQQALFFNALAMYVKKWQKQFCFQLEAIIENEELTIEGKNIMGYIGEYGKYVDG